MGPANGHNGTKGTQKGPHQPAASGAAAPPVQLPLFEMSSQFRHWRYSAASLDKARAELNASAVNHVRSMLEQEKDIAGVVETAAPAAPKPSEIEYLTVEDEQSLVTYYLLQLTRLCKMFKLPVLVESTAMSYLKRFYLRNTCMEYHPKNVMLTCLFLSTKTENFVVSLDSFTSQIPKCTNEDVLSLEFLVSQSLKFQFKCHHAVTAGRGMMLDLQTHLDDQASIDELTEVTHAKAYSTILALRLTDAEFLYTPSQIALAAFHMVDPRLAERWLTSKLRLCTDSKLRHEAGNSRHPGVQELLDAVVQPLTSMAEAAKAGRLTDVEKVRQVDRRLRFCRNPEKDPNSSLYKKRQREAEEEISNKKVKKDETMRQKQEGLGDPFS